LTVKAKYCTIFYVNSNLYLPFPLYLFANIAIILLQTNKNVQKCAKSIKSHMDIIKIRRKCIEKVVHLLPYAGKRVCFMGSV
jgi:hypothetical protein